MTTWGHVLVPRLTSLPSSIMSILFRNGLRAPLGAATRTGRRLDSQSRGAACEAEAIGAAAGGDPAVVVAAFGAAVVAVVAAFGVAPAICARALPVVS